MAMQLFLADTGFFRTESASLEEQLQRFLLVRNLTKVVRIGKNAERVELDRAMQLFLADAGFFI